MVVGAMDLQVISPMTFINDPEIKVALAKGLAQVASCDVDWVSLNLTKIYKQFRRLNSSFQQLHHALGYMALRQEYEAWARRLGKTLVRMDYQIQVPPPNNAYLVKRYIDTNPTWNTTNQLRLQLISAIGTPAGLIIESRHGPAVTVVFESPVPPLPRVPVNSYIMKSSPKTISGVAVSSAPQKDLWTMALLCFASLFGLSASHFCYH